MKSNLFPLRIYDYKNPPRIRGERQEERGSWVDDGSEEAYTAKTGENSLREEEEEEEKYKMKAVF